MSQSVMFWTMTHLPPRGKSVYICHEWAIFSPQASTTMCPLLSAPTTLPFPSHQGWPRVGKEGGWVSWNQSYWGQNIEFAPNPWKLTPSHLASEEFLECFSLVLASLEKEEIFSSKMNLFLPFCSGWGRFAFFLNHILILPGGGWYSWHCPRFLRAFRKIFYTGSRL